MNDKRSRGRPRGTGKPDHRHLEAIADLIAAAPEKTPTRAMHEHFWALEKVGLTDPRLTGGEDAAVRRWQAKWKGQASRLMAEARERRNAAELARRRPGATHQGLAYDPLTGLPLSGGMAAYQDMMERQRRLAETIDPLHVRQMRELANSPQVRAALEYAKSPEFKMAREMLKSLHDRGVGPFRHR